MMKRISRLLVFFILLTGILSGPTGTKAQQTGGDFSLYFPIFGQALRTSWIGPFGGRIAAVAADPTNPATVYAGSFGAGVFKSVDGGDTWTAVNAGLPTLFINALAVDPANPAVLYAGPYEHKLYKSTDGGSSWFPASEGIQEKAIVYSIAIDPHNSANVYISTRGIPTNGWAPWKGVVYKSRDAGATWSTSLAGIGGSEKEDWVYSLAVNPNATNVVYAASHQHGPFRSDDYGDSWESITAGISDASGREIAIEPHSAGSGVVYLGVWHGAAVYKSSNGGNSWAASNRAIVGAKIFRMAIDPLHTSTVYATGVNGWGILKTEDGGQSWSKAGLQDKDTYVIAINRSNPDILLTGTLTDGIWKTTDAGDSWHHSQTGLRNTSVTSVLAFAGNPNTLVASTDDGGGISMSIDQGKTWSDLNNGLGNRAVSGLVANPANPNQIFALTQNTGLFRMDLAAKTSWTRTTSLLLNPRPGAVPPAGAVPDPAQDEAPLTPGDPAALDEPVDALELEGVPLAMVFSPADANIAYVGTGSNGVFRSADNARTWATAGLGQKTIVSLAVHPNNPNALYAVSTPGTVWFSPDGGANWTDTGLAGLTVNTLCLDPANPDILYAGTNAGIYSRVTGGGWALLGLDDKTVTKLSVPAGTPGLILAGTTSGVVYSTNGGATWNFGPWELQGQSIRSITIDPNDPHWVYFGSSTQGALKALFP